MLSITPRTLILVTGPTRSGKSEWAESLAELSQQQVIYIATAPIDPTDQEWLARIQQHQLRRPSTWQTLASGADLVVCIQQAKPTDCLLIDALGTWLVYFLEQPDALWKQSRDQLLDCLVQRSCTVIMVAEETGWGVVPAHASGRLFRDRLGDLTRRIGAMADTVYLVTAGYALNLSQLGTPLPPP
jgi:adenosylcobinamide kinase/adenosylcobinamide-phosphate guanylyltransferase